MTTAEWLARVREDRQPLSASQIAQLRPILAPAVPRMRDAAPARQQERRPEHRTKQERNAS